MSKCDLHIHSRHSARSEEWLFRRFDFPDSYSDPKQLYEALRKRGMDYVTITDHDSIDGCLEIAHLPRTFISEQVTTYFPHDGCKLHILVWGISEQQHREIESVRENLFDLQRYLQSAQITHAAIEDARIPDPSRGLMPSVAANIAYGRPDATRESIEAASRAAHAHEFIQSLQDGAGRKGYEAHVGERRGH